MSETAHLELESIEAGLKFAVTTGPGHRMTLDSGPETHDPNPMQALLAALGGCHAMDIISVLRKKRQRVTAYHVEMTGERRSEHPKAYTRIEMVHRLRGHELSAAAVEEAIRLTETKYCSVHFSMDPKIEVISRFEIAPA
ncbi:MAG: OsmC family protein [Candidatus Eiseniibacteriota bacterium]